MLAVGFDLLYRIQRLVMTFLTRCGQVALCLCLCLPAMAQQPSPPQDDSFSVSEIEIDGLERVAASTVLAHAGFGSGDIVNGQVLATTISRLFETGLFRDIEVSRDGTKVIIGVVENPTIRTIRFEGMTELDEDTVLELLANQDIAPGRIYKRGDESFISQGVRSFYRQVNRFLSTASTVTVPLEGNRVDLVVQVSESEAAKINTIRIFGTNAIDEADLKDLMELREGGLFNSFFDRDEFSQSTLEADLDRLRTFYNSDGFVRFDILSHDVRLNSTAGGIEIDIFVSEGARYAFGGVAITGAKGIEPDVLDAAQPFEAGETYSAKLVESYRASLRSMLRDLGHAFAVVDANTAIDDENLRVNVSYSAQPGKVVQVRQVNFRGNNITRDDVLRVQLEIIEGEVFSEDKLEYSLARLRRTNYLLGAQAREIPVSDDQVDVEIQVHENTRGTFLLGAGYSKADGVSYSINFQRNNILGTGNDLRINASTSSGRRSLDVDLNQANITDSGISRRVGVFVVDEDPNSRSGTINSLDRVGARIDYDIPLERNWSWTAGLEVDQTTINNDQAILAASPPTAGSFTDNRRRFVMEHGAKQKTYQASIGLRYDSRDRAVDTKSGLQADAGLKIALPASDAKYYQLQLAATYFRILTEDGDNVLQLNSQVRYGGKYAGAKYYPYYRRYHIATNDLRGFSSSTGIRDSAGVDIGGQVYIGGSAEVERKMDFFDGESVRGGVFLDVAGLWDDYSHFRSESGDFRASVGVLLRIRTPVFPLLITYGVPIKKLPNDSIQKFQFRLGG